MSNIIETAQKEYEEELFREEVEKYKVKLRTKTSIWDKVFPWKLLIIRKDQT